MLLRGLALNPSPDDMSRAVMLSCASGQQQVLKELLKRGAQAGENAMWAACRAGSLDAIKELQHHGVPFTERDAEICARAGHTAIIAELAAITG